MNCIAASGKSLQIDAQRNSGIFRIWRLSGLLVLAICGACGVPASDTFLENDRLEYSLRYTVSPFPELGIIRVEMSVGQSRGLLREVQMDMPTDFFSELDADGDVANENGKVIWNPPPDGGTLRWAASVNRRKSSTTFDAYMTRDWALFRGSDIIPPARTKSLRGAQSETELRFDLPMNWSSTTQYAQDDGSYVVKNPKRRFDRPTGWMMLGKTGSRTDRIADVRVIISGPQKQNIRRLDMLAFLRWNLAEITQVFPDFPERLTVFSAAEPMWRGGLSAPASVYIHQSRPLISENGTSTLLHEVVHVALGAKAANDADWIIEGMAEYYGLQAMLRSGTISKSRYDSAIASLAQWAKDAPVLCGRKSSGAITAKATVTMYDLDQELQKNSEGRYSLDDVARSLAAQDSAISVADLSDILGVYSDEPSRVLESANVDNCIN